MTGESVRLIWRAMQSDGSSARWTCTTHERGSARPAFGAPKVARGEPASARWTKAMADSPWWPSAPNAWKAGSPASIASSHSPGRDPVGRTPSPR